MLALGIRYLNGWAIAAVDGAKKEHTEWPPHPDRVFMALAAAWFETGEDPGEGEALRWLEELTPPSIVASGYTERTAFREDRPTVSYVPVNDSQVGRKIPDTSDLGKLKGAGLSILPEFRRRQPRRFPTAVPFNPNVFFTWSGNNPGRHREPLERLVRKVTHIGHSASFVQVWLDDDPPEPNWVPVNGHALHRLRVTSRGRLYYLRERYNRENVIEYGQQLAVIDRAKGAEKKKLQVILKKKFGTTEPVQLRPESGLWQGYDRPVEKRLDDTPGSIFDSRLIVFALKGKRFSLTTTLRMTETVRRTILSKCSEPIPEWVSGHRNDGSPSEDAHIAIVPLPFVGHAHSDGRLMGIALAVPRGTDPAESANCFSPLLNDAYGSPRITKLFDGSWFECGLELETRETPPSSLQSVLWTRPSRVWASVTPVVLDRHFDGNDKWERAAESVKDSCERIGLPRPVEVLLHPISTVKGVPHSRDFPPISRKNDGGRRHHSHALIVFEKLIEGPVIVGAGRFRGYGLCRPMKSEG